VTGSAHAPKIDQNSSVLVKRGLNQMGWDIEAGSAESYAMEFRDRDSGISAQVLCAGAPKKEELAEKYSSASSL
jgi:hypothetical protein